MPVWITDGPEVTGTVSTADGPTMIWGGPPHLVIQGPPEALERVAALLCYYGFNTRDVQRDLRKLTVT